jgi:benzoyl-CoA reductase/2-hydroxyglutaryl-CoA dehydratase subunit BcrC/BadD/HgdB
MWGGVTELRKSDKYLQRFCCTIMRANTELALNGVYDFLKAVIIPTYCDSMKAVLANWQIFMDKTKVISYVTIQNRYSTGAFDFVESQNKLLLSQLEEISGTKITLENIENAFSIYDGFRKTMREFLKMAKDYPTTITPKVRHKIIKASYFMDKKDYTEMILELMRGLKEMPRESSKGPKVILSGLMIEPDEVLDVFTDLGYRVVGDDLAQESRQFRVLPRANVSAWDNIVYRFIDMRGCSFLYEENKSRGAILKEMVKANDADGIIICTYKFCDPDEFDYPVIKQQLEASDIPLTQLEIDQQTTSVENIRTRLQGFSERLGY